MRKEFPEVSNLTFQTFVFSMKDEMRDLTANLYAIVVCGQTDESRLIDAMETLTTAINDKVTHLVHISGFYGFVGSKW